LGLPLLSLRCFYVRNNCRICILVMDQMTLIKLQSLSSTWNIPCRTAGRSGTTKMTNLKTGLRTKKLLQLLTLLKISGRKYWSWLFLVIRLYTETIISLWHYECYLKEYCCIFVPDNLSPFLTQCKKKWENRINLIWIWYTYNWYHVLLCLVLFINIRT